jgi:hypothetical protein
MEIMNQIFSEICGNEVFKLPLDHHMFTDLTQVCVKEQHK